jgi:acyl-CoA synthetase (NDP forming)
VDANLEAFLNPQSVAVVGATERPDAWGSFVMRSMLSVNFPGRIFPVNRQAETVYGIKAYHDLSDIPDPIDLAIVAVPDRYVEDAIRLCGERGVKGITIITAGFGETSEEGKERQIILPSLTGSHGTRLLGPNVSGTFNLHAGFNGSGTPANNLLPSPLSAVCQGGYAFYDMLSSGWARKMGVGKFIHTGNECDVTITDFLEYFGHDPETKAIVMYIEAVRDGRRFMDVARETSRKKPVIVYKAGKTAGGSRAARSHTGAMAGPYEVYKGLLRQGGIVVSPAMEMLLPLGHAMVEKPVMRGNRVGIITVGGSWGVSLTDALEETGLVVPEFSPDLQQQLRDEGLPDRASTRNPVDFGASGLFISQDVPQALARHMLTSDEIDALVIHGFGRPGLHSEDTTDEDRLFAQIEKAQLQSVQALERELGKPVIIGSYYSPWESQVMSELNQEGIRVYNRLHDIAWLLAGMKDYGVLSAKG